MKIVFSYSPKYSFKSASEKLDILYLYFLSNMFAREYSYETVMFCPKEHEDMLLNINYSEIVTLPSENLYEYPDWADNSSHKLQAIAAMREPFLYLNPTSIFFKRDILERISADKEDNVYYCNQEVSNDFLIEKSHKILKKYPEYNGLTYRNKYYNTAVFGGNNWEVISKSAEVILNFLQENLEYLDFICGDNYVNLENKHTRYFANLARMIDSVWLPQLCDNISGGKLMPIFSNKEIRNIEKKAFDRQDIEGNFEIQDKESAIFQIAKRHADLINRIKSEENFFDNKVLSIEEINKIKGYAMMKYGITF